MNAATGIDDGIEFRWLPLSTGHCASIFIKDAECVLLDQVDVIMNTMMEEFELESCDFRVVDDPIWKLSGEAVAVWMNFKERTNVEENDVYQITTIFRAPT